MQEIIKLPEPDLDLEYPLMKALENRRSKRKWTGGPLSYGEIGNLLWAACGITKEETKTAKSKRTAPSATNSQEIKIYIAAERGVFLYDEKSHRLEGVLSRDIRQHIGTQKMMKSAPLGLIYVSDFSKFKTYFSKDENKKWFVSGTDTGFISENVYLYCAASGLNTVILGLVDREKLHDIMGLKENEKIIYTQVVGMAAE